MSNAWRAAEWFVSSDAEARRQGLAALSSAELHFSPLVLFLFAARLDEPDLELRRDIIAGLARCFKPGAPLQARDYLVSLLARFDRAQVEWLLESIEGPIQPAHFLADHRPVALLLDRVPQLAGLLTRIASDRTVALETRLAALAALADLGVLEALPALEGLKTRVEGQSAGQLAMTFAPAPERDSRLLLRTVNAAIDALRENE